MASSAKQRKIDELMSKASESLTRTRCFEAERMALRALTIARQNNDFESMARIVSPLYEARRERFHQALDVGRVTIIEAAITEADKRDLVDPEQLRQALDNVPRRPGIGVLREVLDRRTYTLTDSQLERRFLPIARSAGLPPPLAGHKVNGFKVDF